MTTPSQAVAASPANEVPLAGHNHSGIKIPNMISHSFDDPNEFMSNWHWSRNRSLSPGIPIVDMNVRPANRRFQDSNQNIKFAHLRQRDFLQPKSWTFLLFYQRSHRSHRIVVRIVHKSLTLCDRFGLQSGMRLLAIDPALRNSGFALLE